MRDAAGGRDQFKNMTLDERGRIVAVGSAELGTGRGGTGRGGTSFAVARSRQDGRPDQGFGSDGLVVTPVAADDGLGLAGAVAIDGKGRLTVGGSAEAGGPFGLALARTCGRAAGQPVRRSRPGTDERRSGRDGRRDLRHRATERLAS
ncbi:hypothetical protein [Streptomyces katrae]|uniref:hypothetical protein n=1 Tax=Streptomyces katrae TaxID=68223 RepID=UPI0018FF6F26|nr:hypothetical protein [Streptomyces katrae]